MSKETTAGTTCRCGQSIYYTEYHWRVCPERDKWKLKPKQREDKKSGRS